MTVTVDLPPDLVAPLRAWGGPDLPGAIVALLRGVVGPTAGPHARLAPAVYPDDGGPGDAEPYRPVPLRPAGAVTARLVPAGRLVPAVLPDE